MGYYLALIGTLACVFILGWWTNDWWRERNKTETKEVESNEDD